MTHLTHYLTPPNAAEYSPIDQFSSWGKVNRVVFRGGPIRSSKSR